MEDTLMMDRELYTVTDKAIEILKHQILFGVLSGGTKLKHAELAQKLEISTTPVREALTRLEQDRLVEYVPRKGWFVKVITQQEAQQIYEIREYLEGLAASRLCQIITQEQIESLERYLVTYDERFDQKDIIGCITTDILFHKKITEYSGNTLVKDFMNGLFDRIFAIRRMDNDIESLGKAVSEHREIMEALKTKDSLRAEQTVRRHINTCQEIIHELLKKQKTTRKKVTAHRKVVIM